MTGCQDAKNDGDQGDLPVEIERPGTGKVVNAQILARGYTKGLLFALINSSFIKSSSSPRKSWFGHGVALSKYSLVKSISVALT